MYNKINQKLNNFWLGLGIYNLILTKYKVKKEKIVRIQ